MQSAVWCSNHAAMSYFKWPHITWCCIQHHKKINWYQREMKCWIIYLCVPSVDKQDSGIHWILWIHDDTICLITMTIMASINFDRMNFINISKHLYLFHRNIHVHNLAILPTSSREFWFSQCTTLNAIYFHMLLYFEIMYTIHVKSSMPCPMDISYVNLDLDIFH